MPKIKDISAIASKWGRVTPQRTPDFEAGVKNPKSDWKTNTAAANDRYKAGVTAAANANRFATGVNKAGTEKWQRKTIEKGVDRWGPGVASATSDFEAGFHPYHDVIASTTLPPKFPKGDPRNIQRVAALASALHNKKIKG